ncbi:MAG TPA: hypothetical protein VM537_16445 [Anaerolineae bacterium]|nr:hypothetical protein [Anaerolineae bacterium]
MIIDYEYLTCPWCGMQYKFIEGHVCHYRQSTIVYSGSDTCLRTVDCPHCSGTGKVQVGVLPAHVGEPHA